MNNLPEIIEDTTTSEMIEWQYFVSSVYKINKPEFLSIKSIVIEHLNEAKKNFQFSHIGPLQDVPFYQTLNLIGETRLLDFMKYIGTTAAKILSGQGYNMKLYDVVIYELWCQEHLKHSGQEYHIHGNCQLSGFYFLECPENSSKIVYHDPRPAKVYANLIETNDTNVTNASQAINFVPEVGTFMFSNSWLPHTFTQNNTSKSFKFVHFNLGVMPKRTVEKPAEVI
jgi:uncharacterized protein (TIGR02466 family)